MASLFSTLFSAEKSPSDVEIKSTSSSASLPDSSHLVQRPVASEAKAPTTMVVLQPSLPKSILRGALRAHAGVVNNGRTGGGWENYTVRLALVGGINATAGGVISYSFACDPVVSSLPEWTNFAALFDEVKVVGFRLTLCQYNSPTSTVTSSPICVGSFTRTTSAPSSATAVAVAPDAVLLNGLMTNNVGYCHVMSVPQDILYAATSSPTAGPYAGCPGSIQLYGTATNSAEVLNFMLVGHYALRGRL